MDIASLEIVAGTDISKKSVDYPTVMNQIVKKDTLPSADIIDSMVSVNLEVPVLSFTKKVMKRS